MDMGGVGHSMQMQNRTTFGNYFSIFAVLIAFLATIPWGSVGFFAMQGVAAITWILGTIGVLAEGSQDRLESWPNKKRLPWAMSLLVAWCGFQLWPLPESWAGLFWRGDMDLWGRISEGASRWTIAVDQFVSLHTLLLWSGLGILAWGCSTQIKRSAGRLFLLMGLLALGVFQSILGIFILKSSSGRICGTFGSPDALAGLLVMTIPVTLGVLFSHLNGCERKGSSMLHRLGYDWRIWRNLLTVAALGIQGTALYFTGSRGAAFSTIVAIVMMLMWLGRERRRLRTHLWAAGVALLVMMVLFGIQGRHDNLMERTFGEFGEFQQATASRVEIWKSAARLCKMFPLGTGPGGTALVLPMFQTGAYGRYRLDFAHNDSLQFLGDLGIVGFCALTWGLILILRRGAWGCRKNIEEDGKSVWLVRGTWVAVWGALIHAQVEFNLSGRPGIQVVFVLLLGLLWGAHSGPYVLSGKSAETVRRKWKGPCILLVPICVLVVFLSLRAARAWRLHEGVSATLGLTVDEHEWFQRPMVKSEDAISVLGKAADMVPRFSKIHSTLAEAQLVLQDQRIQQAARSILMASGEEVPAELEMNSLLPSQEAAVRLAGLALRVEEKKMLQAARKEANESVRLAPWDALARITRSKVLLRGFSEKYFVDDERICAQNDLEVATRLYPQDAGVLADACLALSFGERDSKGVDDLLNWGRRALEIDSSLGMTVLRAWRRARIPTSRLLEIPDLPISFLWSLYSSLRKQNCDDEAGECLVALEKGVEREVPPASSTLWTPTFWKYWINLQSQYRIQIIVERVKRCLRLGDWEGLYTLSNSPAKLRRERFQMEWDRMNLPEASSFVLRRLHLREWELKNGLLPEWRLEYRLLELGAGMSAKWLQEPLAEVILMEGISSENLNRLLACRATMGDATFLEYVMDAKNAESTGKLSEALSLLDSLLNRERVPSRFLHRIWLWRANLLERDGQMNAAIEAVQKAALACPSDPDVVEAMERLGCAPRNELKGMEPKLDIGFRGERLLLKYAYLEGELEGGEGLQLNLIWHFKGGLPPDLKMEVRIRGQENQVLIKRNTVLDEEETAYFNRGTPIPGSQWTWTVPISSNAVQGERVEVLLLSENKLLMSDEGLSVVEINMRKLPHIP